LNHKNRKHNLLLTFIKLKRLPKQMLTENAKALIAAAVDGELNPAETHRFRRLLDTSAEASALYDRLKADSERLRNLPTAVPPANLLQRVMAKVAALTPPPGTLSSPKHSPGTQPGRKPSLIQEFSEARSRSTRPWIPIAIAASLLIVVSASSFLFFNRASGKSNSLARNPDRAPAATRNDAADSDWSKWLPPENDPHPIAPTPTPKRRTETKMAQSDDVEASKPPVERRAVAIAPEPRPGHNPDLIASELRPEIQMGLVRPRIPFLKVLTDFELEDTRLQFVDELGRDPAFRIDVFTNRLPRGVECFRNAAKTSGLNVYVDSTTLDRVNKNQLNSVVVYIECLDAKELAELFGKLCTEDAKISPRIFDAIHATPVLEDDQKALKAVLNIEPGLFKRPAPDKAPDLGKPISAGTADQIVKSLTTGKGSEKSAILMTWLPAAGRTLPASSAELKQFLLKRGERKTSAVPVIIVIRHGNG
jgi:anti-sigma factor RsiW